jgi:hypothetical protein
MTVITLYPNVILYALPADNWRPVLFVHATLFRPLRQHADTSPMNHQMNQLAAVRRCEDLARRRRCPSDSAAPPPGDCTGFEIGAAATR